jgi:hypothetical protein
MKINQGLDTESEVGVTWSYDSEGTPTGYITLDPMIGTYTIGRVTEGVVGGACADTGVKYDDGKPRMTLIPQDVLKSVAMVLTLAAKKKYGAHNWRKGLEWCRVLDGVQRHIASFIDGEDIDSEFGITHLDHAICGLLFVSHYLKTGTGTDDRNK